MRTILFLLLLTTARLSSATLSVQSPQLGEVYQFNRIKAVVSISNGTDSPAKLVGIEALRPEDRVIQAPTLIAAGASATAEVEMFSGADLGNSAHGFRIRFEGQPAADQIFSVNIFGLSVLDDPTPRADFGVVRSENPAAEKTVVLESHDAGDLRIEKVLEVPDFVEARIDAQRRGIAIRMKKDADWGIRNGTVKLALSSHVQPEVWIPVRADVQGDVVPSVNPVDLGTLRIDEENSYLIRLESRSGKRVKVVDAALQGISGKVEAAPCIPEKPSCAVLKVGISKLQTTGPVTGLVTARIADVEKQVSVIVGGFVISKTAKVVSIDDSMKQSKSAPAPADALAPARVDLRGAIKGAIRQDEQKDLPPPEGRGPLLKWSVANEQTVYGYVIYRAEAEQGPYSRINKEMLRAAGDEHVDGVYQWRDVSAQPGKTYWYSIAVVQKDGRRQQLTGAQKVLAQ